MMVCRVCVCVCMVGITHWYPYWTKVSIWGNICKLPDYLVFNCLLSYSDGKVYIKFFATAVCNMFEPDIFKRL